MSIEPRAWVSEMNGYTQRVPMGTNPFVRRWDIQYPGLTPDEQTIVTDFIEAVGSWGTISYDDRLWVIEKDSIVSTSQFGSFASFGFTLRQVYEP